MAAAEEDIFSVAVWIIYFLTFAWFALLFWDRHKRFRKRAARKVAAKTILRRQAAPVGKRFEKTTHTLFSTAKRAVSQCMARRDHIGRRMPQERQAILGLLSRYYAVAITLEERLIDVNRRAGEDNAFHMNTSEQALLQEVANETANFSNVVLNAVGINNPHPVNELTRCSDELYEAAKKLGGDAVSRLDWGIGSWQFEDLEQKIVKHIRFADQRWLQEEDEALMDQDEEEDEHATVWTRLWQRIVDAIPHQVRAYPYFYGLFYGGYIAILLSHFAFIGTGKMRGHTFLSLPPYYDLENVKLQAYMIPIVYGVMHGSLYCLGWLPVPMTRGFLRDIGLHARWLRPHIPIDDTVYFHQTAGVLSIGGLFVGSTFFLLAMTPSCYDEAVADAASRTRACTAYAPVIVDATTDVNDELLFDSIPIASYFDPRDNVLFLREVVWPTWFFGMPLIYWARQAPKWLPRILQVNWYGFVYYTHLIFSWVTVLTALYARFEVFYPVAISWSIYFIDKAREMVYKTYVTEILVDARSDKATTRCYESSKDGQPTLLNLIMNKPYGFQPGAGQWLYIQVPDIDHVWHPFTLATSSYDDYVELDIGIRGEWSELRGEEEEWLQDPKWATWTYKLMQKFREHANMSVDTGLASPIKARLRGPYGSPFTKCFNPKYKAAVLIGAGTGLTAALSVLKEMVYRRIHGEDEGRYVWFVWSCRRVDDLLWCWSTLERTLQQACSEGAVDLDEDWCPWTSNMLDWLSITIYISRADRSALEYFLNNGSGEEDRIPEASVINMMDQEYVELHEMEASRVSTPVGRNFSDVSAKRTPGNRNRRQSALLVSNAASRSHQASRLKSVRNRRQSALIMADSRPSSRPPSRGNKSVARGAKSVSRKPHKSVRFTDTTNKMRLFPSTRAEDDEDVDMLDYQLLSEEAEVEDEFAWLNRDAREPTSKHHGHKSMSSISEEPGEEGDEDSEYHLATMTRGGNNDSDDGGSVDPAPFLMGIMTRQAAENQLHDWNMAGGFVVRESSEKGHVLSYLPQPGKSVVHFVLKSDAEERNSTWTLGGIAIESACSTLEQAVSALMTEGHELMPVPLLKAVPKVSKAATPLQAAAAAVISNPKDRNLKLALKNALEQDLQARTKTDVHTWLQQQVMNASMDHKDGHIVKLLLWVKNFLDENARDATTSEEPRMTVCFCGPSTLAGMIAEATSAVGGGFEFNAEFQ
jgi:hypothetical protein